MNILSKTVLLTEQVRETVSKIPTLKEQFA